MDTQFDLTPLILSFKLAFITTIILFFISIPIAFFLSQTKSKIKIFFETLFSLPIVLPPTVLGFYLLLLFSKTQFNFAFTFKGIVIASIIYSFPFMLGPIQSAMESLNKSLIEASYTLGKSKLETLIRVIIPNIKPSIITAVVTTFAHTVGEFGVVLMVGGSIPGVTKVASIAVYDYVENLDYKSAFLYSLILLVFSFFVLLFVYIYRARK